ncbi:hypothetical protein K1719_042128 [Acacia pycnantha]|nr:hypothetical protein K1719_042128 [Acacia pycnantha]
MKIISWNCQGMGRALAVRNLRDMEVKGVRSFQFEAIWVEHDNFLLTVREGWKDVVGVEEDQVLDLVRRLKACQQKLEEWSKQVFPHFRRAIAQLRSKLNECHIGSMTEESILMVEELTRQIEEMWRKEESYWWQRSRIAWLNCGDRNTKFFHSTVIQRRIRNKVLRLKNENGIWMEERADINRAFSDFYLKLFRSGGVREMEQALAYVKKCVTEDDNNQLMARVTSQEIETAVFQLGANKAPGPDGFSALFYQAAVSYA